MPGRKPVDPNAPVPGADADQSEALAAQQAESPQVDGKAGRRNRMAAPQQGDSVRLRGTVVEPIQQVIQNRGRPEGSLQVKGRLFNGTTGVAVSDEREWTVVVNNYLATVSKEVTKAGDEIEAAGKWVETYRAGRYTISNEIQAWDLHPPLAAGLDQTLSGPGSEGLSAGDSSAGASLA
jgi:hypothetical protein